MVKIYLGMSRHAWSRLVSYVKVNMTRISKFSQFDRVKGSLGQRKLEVSSGGLLPTVGGHSLHLNRIEQNTVVPQPLVGSTLVTSEKNKFPSLSMKGGLPVM